MLEALKTLLGHHHESLRGYTDRRFNALEQEIRTMGTTISQQQDDNTAALTADLAKIQAGVTDLQAQLAAAGGKAGETISQAQEDALTGARTTADALAAVFTATPAPAPAA